MAQRSPTIDAAALAVLKAADRNPHITPEQLRNEADPAFVYGWLSLPAVKACNASEFVAAMLLAARALEDKLAGGAL